MDGQQDRSTNSKAVRMTDWKHPKPDSAFPMKVNFPWNVFNLCHSSIRRWKEYGKMSPALLYSSLFSLIWLADYIERMGVRACSCCGNGLLFVKGYIPGIWCVCAAIDKNPACWDWRTDWGFCQAGQDGGLRKGGRCANRTTGRLNWDIGKRKGCTRYGEMQAVRRLSRARGECCENGGDWALYTSLISSVFWMPLGLLSKYEVSRSLCSLCSYLGRILLCIDWHSSESSQKLFKIAFYSWSIFKKSFLIVHWNFPLLTDVSCSLHT